MGKLLIGLGAVAALWLGGKYLLPLLLPFLLGGAVALSAEPLVYLCHRKLKLPRAAAAGLGVTVTLLLLAGFVSILGAILVRELGRLADGLPDLEATAIHSMGVVESWLLDLAAQTPAGLQPVLTRTLHQTFDGSADLMAQVTGKIPQAVGAVISWVPSGALGFGTGLLSAFMISARLPKLRQTVAGWLPETFRTKASATLQKIRHALSGWLRAQGKLMLLTFGVVALGFLVLRIPYGILWAALIALVDAVPMLGTGIVLLPWALASLLQGQQLRALMLVLIFGVATILRTTLEPKLVGDQLGLDPLLALLALYIGFRLWGFWGLLLAPMLASITKSLLETTA